MLEIRDLDIKKVLSQLSLFSYYFVEQKGVIEGNW